MLLNNILLSPFNISYKKELKNNFSKLSKERRGELINKILSDKFSSYFLHFLEKNKKLNLLTKKELSYLKNQSNRYFLQSFEIVKEAISVDKILKKNNLNPVFLKGVALLGEYDDFTLRQAVDIDILLTRDQAFKAYKILKKNGYYEYRSEYKKIRDLEEFSDKNLHLPELCKDSKIMIEIHHRVTRKIDFEICPLSNKMIQNKESFDFFGNKLFRPSKNDLISHLLLNFALNDCFNNSLRIFSDIHVLEKKFVIDWESVYNENTNEKVRRAISLCLEILNFDFNFTNGFNKLKGNYKKSFCDSKIVKIGHKKTFTFQEQFVPEDSLFILKKSKNFYEFFNFAFKKIFLSKDEISNKYKISKNNYLLVIFYMFISVCSRIYKYSFMTIKFYFKKGDIYKNFESYNNVKEWLK